MEKNNNLQQLRESFNGLHAAEHPATEQAAQEFKAKVVAHAGNTYFEELQTVAYNPDFQLLEAIFIAKQPTGYSGNLCTDGSVAFVRFYLDYGSGWEDQGYSGVNEHDIPTGTDCSKQPEKPLSYSASLKINPRRSFCDKAVLPKARAILEWNKIPPAGMPGYNSIWGDTVDDVIQIKPMKKIIFDHIDFSSLAEMMLTHPQLKLSEAAGLLPGGGKILQQTQLAMQPKALELPDLVNLYQKEKTVSAGRFALSSVQYALKSTDTAQISQQIENFKQYGIDWAAILAELGKTNANTTYEQLEKIGLDYNLEQFVASFRIKRPAGYAGGLCSSGSLEYVSFWADWNNDCTWDFVGTTSVNVHDIGSIPAGGLSYAAVLPYDFNKLRQHCTNPEVVKIRAVLSWNLAPSQTDADKLEYWGNRLDAYIQVKPGYGTGTVQPIINILGGIPVDKISNADGLTTPGAKFALNQAAVYDNSPFGGIIVVQGPPFAGYQYRIKVSNMATLASYYIGNDFTAVGWLMVPPYVQYTTVSANPFTHYYPYQPYDKNTDNVLARWSPGTNDLLRLDMDIQGIPGVFTKFIQMDNASPEISLVIDDHGDCTHFKKGDIITGSFSVWDAHLQRYAISSSFGGGINGTANGSGTFSFPTAAATTPCGKVSMIAYEKTIYNSQSTDNYSYEEQIICLQPS